VADVLAMFGWQEEGGGKKRGWGVFRGTFFSFGLVWEDVWKLVLYTLEKGGVSGGQDDQKGIEEKTLSRRRVPHGAPGDMRSVISSGATMLLGQNVAEQRWVQRCFLNSIGTIRQGQKRERKNNPGREVFSHRGKSREEENRRVLGCRRKTD